MKRKRNYKRETAKRRRARTITTDGPSYWKVGMVLNFPRVNPDTSWSVRLHRITAFDGRWYTLKRLGRVRSLWYWLRHQRNVTPMARDYSRMADGG